MPPPDFCLAAVGNVILLHPFAASMHGPASAGVLDLLRNADVVTGNCEFSAFQAATAGLIAQSVSGRLSRAAGPDRIADLRTLGFTLVARANHRALDFGIGGMQETDRLLTAHGIAHAGTGGTRAAASAAAYVTTAAGRTALVSASGSAPRFAAAGAARSDMAGRPGVNLIRSRRVNVVDPKTFDALLTAIDLSARHGLDLGQVVGGGNAIHGLGALIRKGDRPEVQFVLDANDVAENIDQVRVARHRADHVVYALHMQLPDNIGDAPPQAVRELAHAIIDAGADAFIGHGARTPRGIEIYNGRPIFYGLGNFVGHEPTIAGRSSSGGEPAVNTTRRLARDALVSRLANLREVWESPDKPDYRNRDAYWESVIARVVHRPRGRTVELHPIELARDTTATHVGTPGLAAPGSARRIIDRLVRLSAAFGTRITFVDGMGVIDCSS